MIGELVAVLVVVAIAIAGTALGIRFGIVVLAPRIARALDRPEDEVSDDGRD
jgi:hypothetical protein